MTNSDPANPSQAPTVAAASSAGPTLAAPTHGSAAAPLGEGPGTLIGPYKLLQAIGEGGFGSVFLAEQEQPVRRRVALKIIKLGMDTRAVIARFEAERQALAMMDHPNIAKVLDAGATNAGRPYFVMELVKGDPITDYCDKGSLSIPERLALFIQVCHAVQHAHHKGIIHRDLKPSNILVSTQDGRPLAKVIDFGIAKATASRLTEKTLFTEHKQLIGTPEYMSPEQAEGSLDIDTRTDVYALGVLLYELLTGSTPFSSKELRSGAYAEIQRIIREIDPPKPSTRLSQSTDTLATVAARRHTEPRRLNSQVRGELDWIVMKTLEKNRQRRYETASGLAADVQRYLAGQAVEAAPPSAAYRIRKFIGRHRGPVAAVGIVALVLLLGIVGTTLGLVRAEHQRRLAVDARNDERRQRDAAVSAQALADQNRTEAEKARAAEAEERKKAQTQAARAEAVAEFLRTMLTASDPQSTGGRRDAKVSDVLDKAARDIGSGLTGQPEVEATVRATIGSAYAGLDRFDQSNEMFDAALSVLRPLPSSADPIRASALNGRGVLRLRQDHYPEAIADFDRALALTPESAADRLELRYTIMENRGNAARFLGREQETIDTLKQVLEGRTKLFGPEDSRVAQTRSNLATMLKSQGKAAEAAVLHREALAVFKRKLGENDPITMRAVGNLASTLQSMGKFPEAEVLFEDNVERARRVFGDKGTDTAGALELLASCHYAMGRYDDSEREYREANEILAAVAGPADVSVASSLTGIVRAMMARERTTEAEPFARRAVEITRTALGPESDAYQHALGDLAFVAKGMRRFDEAEATFRELLALSLRLRGQDHPETLIIMENLAGVLLAKGDAAGDEVLVVQVLEARRRVLGEDNPAVARTIYNLGVVRAELGKHAQAEELFREALARFRKQLGDKHPNVTAALGRIARTRAAQDDLEQAETLQRDVLQRTRAAMGPRTRSVGLETGFLGEVLRKRAKFDEAEPLLLESRDILESLPAPDPKAVATSITRLADLYEAWGKPDQAAQWRARSGAQPPAAEPPK